VKSAVKSQQTVCLTATETIIHAIRVLWKDFGFLLPSVYLSLR